MQENISESKKNNAVLPGNMTSRKEIARAMLWRLAKETDACQGAFYIAVKGEKSKIVLRFTEGYAHTIANNENIEFEIGDGLVGQVAADGKFIQIENIPEGYLTVVSGLGKSSPTHLIIYPFVNENKEVVAVIELAAFKPFTDEMITTISNAEKIVTEALNNCNE